MNRWRPLRDAMLAISLMTVVPTGHEWPKGEKTRMAGWLPFAGLLLGAAAWGFINLCRVLTSEGHAALVVSALVVAGWAALTRLLHWDGLADLADALWGGDSPDRRLAIMSDSHTGAFGAAAVALTAIVEVAAIASIVSAGHERPVLFVPALSRLAATFAAWFGTPARPGGLGRSVMGRPDLFALAPVALVLALVGGFFYTGYGVSGVWFSVAAVTVALAVPHALSRPVGGVTGDVMGASVLLTEAAVMALAALMWGV